MTATRKERREQAVADTAARVMSDTKYQALRTRPARVALAVSMIALIGLIPTLWIGGGAIPGLVAVGAAIVVWLLLRVSVRLVTDLPDEYLDERQTDLRNRTYLESYRWFAALVIVLAAAGLLAFVLLSDDPDTWTVVLDYNAVMGLFFMLEAAAVSVPSVVLALRDRELAR